MNILHISTSDRGGAAKACLRLHNALLKEGINSNILVLYRYDTSGTNIHSFFSATKKSLVNSIYYSLRYRVDTIRKKRAYHRYTTQQVSFSFPHTIYNINQLALVQKADIIHLHWVGRFLDYSSFFSKMDKPVVWTLHDMNPILGGFHYKTDAENAHKQVEDLEKVLGTTKTEILSQFNNLTVVSPSMWLNQLSSTSAVLGKFCNYHIPYGVEIDVFKPTAKEKARKFFNLPTNKKIILFIADSLEDKRKGSKYLTEALSLVDTDNIILCTIGKGSVEAAVPVHNLGFISDEHQIALAYSAADVFVIPSIEDNLPNTVMESLACGTPVVGFDVGGIPDMIRENQTGLLAKVKEHIDLGEKIRWLLVHDSERIEMGKNARQIAEQEYNLQVQAARYINLYKQILT